ncbi:hypothetical protein ACFTZF_19585 [Streptomyces mirabilis]|uniref:hypothetical protein n=1 Tax=Streptomyces mirabilis TaxID=68239 RepID=UPI00363C804A
MESQWRLIAIAWRRPTLADTIVAGVTWDVLHTASNIHEAMAGAAAFLVLRCARIHFPARSRR